MNISVSFYIPSELFQSSMSAVLLCILTINKNKIINLAQRESNAWFSLLFTERFIAAHCYDTTKSTAISSAKKMFLSRNKS